MPTTIQSNFSGGEWAPEFWGRTDLDQYRHGLKRARNALVLPQGGVTKRPGYRAIAAAPVAPGQPVQLRRFSPSSANRYMLEFTSTVMRVYRKRSLVLSAPATPFTLAMPYLADVIGSLQFTQRGNQLLIWSATHPPQLLSWGGNDTGWSIAAAVFQDGPYLDTMGEGTTITPSAAAASATMTASATAGINNGQGFLASDVGRPVRFRVPSWGLTGLGSTGAAGGGYNTGDTINPDGGTPLLDGTGAPLVAQMVATNTTAGAITHLGISNPGRYMLPPSTSFTQGATSGQGAGLTGTVAYTQDQPDVWLWGVITARHSTTSIDVALQAMLLSADNLVSLQGVFPSTAAISVWRLGAWCPAVGYPAAGTQFGGRIIAGGNPALPKRVYGSESGATYFTLFAPSLASGQVVDSNGLDFTLDDEQGDAIVWLSGAGKAQLPQLAIGAGDAEFIIQPSPTGAALGATGVQTYRETNYTNAAVAPLHIGRALLFADAGRTRVRKWVYQWATGGYIGPELAPYGRHLLLPGLAVMDYALTPHPVVWQAMRDGSLAGVTYQLDDGAIEAPHSHQLGGSYYGGPPQVVALAITPSEDPTPYDETWLAVLRNDPGGGDSLTIEVSTPYFRNLPLDQAVFVDSAVSSALTLPTTSCTPVLATVDAPFEPSGNPLLPARGDSVQFQFAADVALVADLTPGTVLRLNNGTFRLTAVADARHVTAECLDTPNSLAPAASGFWSYTNMKTVFTGFGALNGRIAALLADGAVETPQLVTGDTITLLTPASYLTAGLGYAFDVETLDLDLTAQDGSSQMKTGRLDHLYLRVIDTVGGEYGPSDGELDAIVPRSTEDLLDWAPALVSDDLRVAFPGGSSQHRSVVVRHSDPWPITLLALVVRGGTMEQEVR